jgi:hypothetical protein
MIPSSFPKYEISNKPRAIQFEKELLTMKNKLASGLYIMLARRWFRHRALDSWAPARIAFPFKEIGGHDFVQSKARKD